MLQKDRKKVLIVDDDDSLRNILKQTLKNSYIVTAASNGKEGLNLFRKKYFDLIITDSQMPLMSGDEMVREIHKKAVNIPIIFMTGDVGSCLQDNTYPVIQKPFEMEILINMIQQILDKNAVEPNTSVTGIFNNHY